ncbi:MAG: MlaD family protein [Planctomycetota bacterium]
MAKRNRNNLAVGITVSTVLAFTIYIVIMLAEWPGLLTAQQKITVRQPYKAGLKGLIKGSPVHLGGVKIGHITNTDIRKLDRNSTDSNDVYVFFTMKIPQQYHLRRDCALVAQSNVLGGQVLLSIEDLGSEGELIEDGQTADILLADSIMEAVKHEFDPHDPNSFLAQIKIDVTGLTRQLRETVAKLDGALDSAKSAMANLKDITGDERAGKFIDNLTEVSADLKPAIAKLDTSLENLKNITGDERVDRIIDNVAEISDSLKHTIAKLNTSLDSAHATLTNLKAITGDERIDRIIGNVAAVSSNLKLTSQEVRRAPWKLLYKTKEKEFRIQALVDSAGAFAAGAERLDNTALRLHKLMSATGDEPQIDKDRIESIFAELEASFEQFQKAEQKFWEELK